METLGEENAMNMTTKNIRMKDSQENYPCRKCGKPCPVTLRPDTPHHGEIRCPIHGHDWVSKPKDAKVSRRRARFSLRKFIPESLNSFCEICLRDEILLKSLSPPLLLEVHHVVEHQRGGEDIEENLRLVCSECHSAIHARRRSFNRYQSHAP